MKKQAIVVLIGILTFLSLISTNCSFSINLTSPTATPTQTPEPTITPSPTPQPSPTQGSYLSKDKYSSPTGAFSMYPPEKWKFVSEGLSTYIGVDYEDPSGSGFINVSFINTGVKLEKAAFKELVNSYEFNAFIAVNDDDYTELNREMDLDNGYVEIRRRTSIKYSIHTVKTIFKQMDNAVYQVQMGARSDEWKKYEPIFEEFAGAITYDPEMAQDTISYFYLLPYTSDTDAFEFWAPAHWAFFFDDSEQFYTYEGFISPNDDAFVESLSYDDEREHWGKAVAGYWAQDTLMRYYAKRASDLVITKDFMNENGLEQMDWYTKEEKLEGHTVIYAKDTQVMMFTVYWKQEAEETYKNLMDLLIKWYEIK